MTQSKTHEVTIKLRFDKPIPKKWALHHAKDHLSKTEYICDSHWMRDDLPETMKIVKVTTAVNSYPDREKDIEELCEGLQKYMDAHNKGCLSFEEVKMAKQLLAKHQSTGGAVNSYTDDEEKDIKELMDNLEDTLGVIDECGVIEKGSPKYRGMKKLLTKHQSTEQG